MRPKSTISSTIESVKMKEVAFGDLDVGTYFQWVGLTTPDIMYCIKVGDRLYLNYNMKYPAGKAALERGMEWALVVVLDARIVLSHQQ